MKIEIEYGAKNGETFFKINSGVPFGSICDDHDILSVVRLLMPSETVRRHIQEELAKERQA